MKGKSSNVLLELIRADMQYDFIYVDGSHYLMDVFLDLFLAFSVLKIGGIMAIDDYTYNYDGPVLSSPFEAVNYFLKEFGNQIKVLDVGYRFFIEKISSIKHLQDRFFTEFLK
jgi:hypothetical protein